MRRLLYDITQLLESADDADQRLLRVLGLLRGLVPYEQCALLETRLGDDPHVVTEPQMAPNERVLLTETLLHLFGQLVDQSARVNTPATRPEAQYLAVPLVGFDEVIGLLFVRSSLAEYDDEHLRALSVVAAKVAAYLTMLRSRGELVELARERDQARRAAEAANRAKDEFLALVAHELKTPLTSMLAWAHTLREASEDEARSRASDELERNIRAQAKLIDDILDLKCIASATQRLNLSLVEPDHWLEVAGDAGTEGGLSVRLAIAKDLVELHAGRLGAESTSPGQGVPSGRRADDRALAGIDVLLVDHDLGLRESFQSVLVEYGAEVTAVGSALEALEALEASRPDVLLFGDLATRESIYELARQVTVRACPLPFASISSWRLEEKERERAAGFSLHLDKPLELGALVDAIAKLAGRGRAPVSTT